MIFDNNKGKNLKLFIYKKYIFIYILFLFKKKKKV
jgi:hypothetical protein